MTTSVVDEFYHKYTLLLEALDSTKEPSLRIWANDNYSRILVLVSANFFESEIKGMLRNLVEENSKNQLVVSFLVSSMERRYHEYSDWEANNANRFFSFLGEDFKRVASADVRSNASLEEGVKAFLEIGRTRNELTHGELLSVTLSKTADEFYGLYKAALVFTEYLREKLRSRLVSKSDYSSGSRGQFDTHTEYHRIVSEGTTCTRPNDQEA